MLSFKYGAAVQGVNALTLFAAIDTEATPFCLSKGTCLFDTGPTVWTLQTARVKVFQHRIGQRLENPWRNHSMPSMPFALFLDMSEFVLCHTPKNKPALKLLIWLPT